MSPLPVPRNLTQANKDLNSLPSAVGWDLKTSRDAPCFIIADDDPGNPHPSGEQVYNVYLSWKEAVADGRDRERIRIIPERKDLFPEEND